MAKLVLAGGGHAHMMILESLGRIVNRGHEVVVIQPSDYHYYSGMGPGMLSGYYQPEDIRFDTRSVVEQSGARFKETKVTRINAEENIVLMEDGDTLSYDVLSCNTGSFVPFSTIEGSTENVFSAKPIERLLEAKARIATYAAKGRISIGVVGGGPAAVEIAGNSYWQAHSAGCRDVEVRMFAGKKMMSGFNESICRIVRTEFESRKIIIDESGYVRKIVDGSIFLENGKSFTPDILFIATGVRPSLIFRDSGIRTGADGGLNVNRFLQSSEWPNIFGGGDCIYFSPNPLDKVGVYAVRQNPILLANVIAALEGAPLRSFDPGGGYLLIFNLGEKAGALQKGPIVFGGRLAFVIKDYIDRKFMRRFQALEKN